MSRKPKAAYTCGNCRIRFPKSKQVRRMVDRHDVFPASYPAHLLERATAAELLESTLDFLERFASRRVHKRRLMAERRRERGGSRSDQKGSERRLRDEVMWHGWHHFGPREFRKMLRKWRECRERFDR